MPSRADELLAVNRLKLKVALGLLTGHTTHRAHMIKLRLTQWQHCQLCRDRKENSMRIVRLYPALACKRCRTFGSMFLKAKGLENKRVKSSISLVSNTRLGIAP